MSSLASLEEDDTTSSMDLDEKKNDVGQEKLVNLVSWLTNKIDKNVEEMQAEIATHMKDTDLRFAEAEARLVETNSALAIKGKCKSLSFIILLIISSYNYFQSE